MKVWLRLPAPVNQLRNREIKIISLEGFYCLNFIHKFDCTIDEPVSNDNYQFELRSESKIKVLGV